MRTVPNEHQDLPGSFSTSAHERETDPCSAANHRIFVSHSHLDNALAQCSCRRPRRALTEDSAVFYDVMGGLHGGDSWWNKIVEELTTRDVFLLILSPDAMNSRWVRKRNRHRLE